MMGCSSSVAAQEKTIRDDDLSEITGNRTSQGNLGASFKKSKNESLNNLLSNEETNSTILPGATNLSLESISAITINRNGNMGTRIKELQDNKGDGISTLSLTSQVVSENGGEFPHTSVDKRSSTQGEKTVAQTESQLILEKALKELSASLFNTNPEISSDPHVSVGVARNSISPTLSNGSNFSDEIPSIVAVIDVGSGFCKAGLSGDDIPPLVIPNVVGRQRKEGVIPGISANEAFIGNDAKLRREALIFTSPIERGVVTNWDDLEKVYDHLLHMELKLDVKDHSIVLPSSPNSTRESRQKLTELMFEKFKIKKLYLGADPSLALHALGMTTGLVVGMGHGVSYAAPVIQGNVIESAVQTTNLGNLDLIRYMKTMVHEEYQSENIDSDIARAIVEKLCYVAADFKREEQRINNNDQTVKTYTLPSGRILTLQKERFLCSEVFFQPSLIEGYHQSSLVDICRRSMEAIERSGQNSIMATDLRRNIVLVGGSSLIPGVNERLKRELQLSGGFVLALPKRQYAAWRGASMLTSLTSSRHRWIDRSMYEEHGSTIVHRKYV